MGNYNGVVWNDSDWPIEYAIYSKHEVFANHTIPSKINHELKVDFNDIQEENRRTSGFSHQNKLKPNQVTFVQVQPGKVSVKNLSQLKSDQYRISLRVKVGEFEKYLIKDIIINALSDITLKIRYDLSIKNLTKEEAQGIIENPSKVTKQSNKADQERINKKYDELLGQLRVAQKEAEKKIQK